MSDLYYDDGIFALIILFFMILLFVSMHTTRAKQKTDELVESEDFKYFQNQPHRKRRL